MKKEKIKKIKAMTNSPNENESEVAKSYLEKTKEKGISKYTKPVKHSYENALEPTEQSELLKVIHSYNSSKRLHHLTLVYLMMYCGLRVSEALQFRREWFIKKDDCYIIKIPFEDKDIINLRKNWRPKTPKGAREIPIYKEFVTSYLDVFLHSNKRIELNRQNAYKTIKLYGKLIDKPNVHPHALRSSFANHLVDKGVTAGTLMYLMGWSKLETAYNYIRKSPHSARLEFKRLEE